jgi:restriction system protein
MNVHDAVIQVLQEAGAPLHAQEITKRILEKKLWETSGKTPAATVSARLYADIKKNRDASPFALVTSQTFGLREMGMKSSGIAPPIHLKATTQPKVRVSAKTYSFTDAAERVLEQFGNKQPMHFREITKKALEMGWLDTEGRTPDATMGAQLYTSIKRAQRRGEQPRFVQHARGVFGLGKWMGHGLAYQITQHNKQVRQTLRKRLFDMEWEEFEDLVARLLGEMEFEDVKVSARRNDKGIDVRGVLAVGGAIRVRMAVQVKKWKHNVQAPVVQQVRGSLSPHEHGVIITTSDFSKGAREEAERRDTTPIALVNGEAFASLLMQNGVGIQRQACELFELTDAVPSNA